VLLTGIIDYAGYCQIKRKVIMLKPSRFNFWATLDEGRYLLFNGISGALYELDSTERHEVLDILNNSDISCVAEGETLAESLAQGGFIISEQVDEVEYLLDRNEIACMHHNVLDLTISPTYQCNFRCKYCYVNFDQGRMSPDVEHRVSKYMEYVFPLYQQVNITWFGGEPLMCMDTVLRLSEKISQIADYHGVALYLFVTTNGYLLTPQNARRLFDVGIRFFHVTIDGSPSCHDNLRVLVNGDSSYMRIYQNIQSLLEQLPDTFLTLRMNTDETNITKLTEVLDDIPVDYRHRVQLNITPIIREGEVCSLDLYQKINQTTRYALENGYSYYDMSIPTNRYTFCAADKRSNFQIGPAGTLHKCSPSDKPEVEVGYLTDQGWPKFNERNDVWHNVLKTRNECLECPYLCFCGGGCRLERLRETYAPACRDKYNDIENLIINYYLGLLAYRSPAIRH
jgi:uncharacterized protein